MNDCWLFVSKIHLFVKKLVKSSVMVSMLSSSSLDCGFEPLSGLTKDYEIPTKLVRLVHNRHRHHPIESDLFSPYYSCGKILAQDKSLVICHCLDQINKLILLHQDLLYTLNDVSCLSTYT
jgi:hypothetical protein